MADEILAGIDAELTDLKRLIKEKEQRIIELEALRAARLDQIGIDNMAKAAAKIRDNSARQ